MWSFEAHDATTGPKNPQGTPYPPFHKICKVDPSQHCCTAKPTAQSKHGLRSPMGTTKLAPRRSIAEPEAFPIGRRAFAFLLMLCAFGAARRCTGDCRDNSRPYDYAMSLP